jgi:glutamine synthetase
MVARADWDTVRITPWVAGTAMILCDLFDVESASPIEVAPRQVLRRQVEAAAGAGFLPMVGSEIEFYLFRDSYDEAHDKGYRNLRPHSPWVQDYHVLQTTKDEYVIGQIRRGLEAAGVPVEFSREKPAGGSTKSTSTTHPRWRWPTATPCTRTRRRRSPRWRVAR